MKNTETLLSSEAKTKAINFLSSGAEKYKKKTKTYTVEEIIEMMEKGKLKLAPVQRAFVTNHSEEMVWSLISGKGIASPIINEKNGKSYIIDGQQRISSILMYATEATALDYKGKVFNMPTKKTAMALNMGKILKNYPLPIDAETKQALMLALNKKTFSQLDADLQEMIKKTEITFTVYKNLTPEEEANVYVDVNNGITSMKSIEITKARCSDDVWSTIKTFGESLNLNVSGKQRFKVEQIVAELFVQFINSVYANVPYANVFSFDKWRTSTAEVLSYFSKKQNEQEFKKQFNAFKKSIAAFENHGYIKNNFYKKDRKTKMFDVSELRIKYWLYINQIFFEEDDFHEKACAAINNFLESPEYYSRRFTFGDSSFTYKELNIQGTSNVENTKKCAEIEAIILKEAGLNVSSIETIREMRKNNDIAQKIGSFLY